MVNIDNKIDCCGCGACSLACPCHCILMVEDNEGFLYPQADKHNCIECGRCDNVCPVNLQLKDREPLLVCAAQNQDQELRLKSSSGGVFFLLAKQIVESKGVVFGAAFNDKWEVVHTYAENLEECRKFLGSKYVQSIIGDTYACAQTFLDQGRIVLFSGTPCQIAGLKCFLGKEYKNLITADVICHGVPSPGMFRWYLHEEIEKFADQGERKNSVSSRPIHNIPKRDALFGLKDVEIRGISFRDKRLGWKKYSFTLDLAKATADGKQNTVSLSYTLDKNPFLKGFLQNLFLRPICHDCPFRDLKSGSDITLGDFWGVRKVLSRMDDDRGTSAVLLNTEKGRRVFETIDLFKKQTSYDIIRKYNAAIWKNPSMPSKRHLMFNGQGGFVERSNRLTKSSLLRRIKNVIKFVIRRK